MARHTSWRVGGCADIWFEPESREDLSNFVRDLPADTPITWIGLGSNVLVRDGGIRGAVISGAALFTSVEILDDGHVIAGASVACTALARQCVRRGFSPAEFLAGIPGTVGGALAMNAGAFGEETWCHVVAVETLDRLGSYAWRPSGDFKVGYREVGRPPDTWFVSAKFRFTVTDDADMERLRMLLDERKARQPLGLPSCGSVFRNPPNDFAGRLIEVSGLKGHRIGGAEISEKHANFIINTGNASASDIEELIELVAAEVEAQQGVALVREVHIIGDAPESES
jgi:UDP-N-acetylmuramate dehydrogenase